jgi:hypothetical protein
MRQSDLLRHCDWGKCKRHQISRIGEPRLVLSQPWAFGVAGTHGQNKPQRRRGTEEIIKLKFQIPEPLFSASLCVLAVMLGVTPGNHRDTQRHGGNQKIEVPDSGAFILGVSVSWR